MTVYGEAASQYKRPLGVVLEGYRCVDTRSKRSGEEAAGVEE